MKEKMNLYFKTVGPPRRIQIVDHTRALWMQHILDQLGLIRSQLGGVVEKYRIYYWKEVFKKMHLLTTYILKPTYLK
jgi:hypothetical protein